MPPVCVQAIDFPAWLQQTVFQQDYVVIYVDLGQGREYEVLQALLERQLLTLIDKVMLRWRYHISVSPNYGCLVLRLLSVYVMLWHCLCIVWSAICMQAHGQD
jgi:hypothetical protein